MTSNIEFEPINKELSLNAGLFFFKNLCERLNLVNLLALCLPHKSKDKGLEVKEQFFTGMMGMVVGAECLDDFDELKHDPIFSIITNGGMASTTLGRFLRLVREKHFEKLQDFLPRMSFQLRQKICPKKKEFILTMDSTIHQQYGKKMEGVDWSYKNVRGLDSQNAFDEYGFSYGFDLRPGNTYSGNGAVEMIGKIFRAIPENLKRYFRADSAYSNLNIYNELLNKKVHFAICLKENVWGSLLDKYGNKMKWHKTKINFFDSEKCEIGSCLYPIKGLAGRSYLRVVFIRTKKKKVTNEDKYFYDYYAIVTDMGQMEMNDETIINFYRKRANVENHIKDLKHGMDFKHFPCQSLMANAVWGMMGIFAYNLMRFASFVLFSTKGCFLKRVRNKMVKLAGEVIRHSRSIKIRVMDYVFQEVKRLEKKIHDQFCPQVIYRSPRHSSPG